MKAFKKFKSLVFVLAGILIVSGLAFQFRVGRSKVAPLVSSFDPGGAAAFFELLNRQGYDVSVSDQPTGLTDDSLLVFFLPAKGAIEGFRDSNEEDPRYTIAKKLVTQAVTRGRSVLILFTDSTESDLSSRATEVPVSGPASQTAKLFGPSSVESNFPLQSAVGDSPIDAGPYSVWGNSGGTVAEAIASGPSVVAGVRFGELALNKYLSSADNAKVLMQIVRSVAPPSGRIQINEAPVDGGSPTSILDVLGPWAKAGWSQFLAWFFVLALVLGVRFGRANNSRTAQNDSKNLLGALANTLAGQRSGEDALAIVARDCDRKVREALHIGTVASEKARNDLLPPTLVAAFSAATRLEPNVLNVFESQVRARILEEETRLFLTERGVRSKSSRLGASRR